MKKTLAILFFVIMFLSAFANEGNSLQSENPKNNEIQVKLGMFPYIESVIAVFGQINNEGEPFLLPVISVEYLRYVNQRNGIGGTFTLGTPYASFRSGNSNLTYAAFQITHRRIYMNKEHVKLYGDIGLGGELIFSITNKDMSPLFAFHVSPIGIWFGSDKLFGTAEITWGSEGSFASIGIGTRF